MGPRSKGWGRATSSLSLPSDWSWIGLCWEREGECYDVDVVRAIPLLYLRLFSFFSNGRNESTTRAPAPKRLCPLFPPGGLLISDLHFLPANFLRFACCLSTKIKPQKSNRSAEELDLRQSPYTGPLLSTSRGERRQRPPIRSGARRRRSSPTRRSILGSAFGPAPVTARHIDGRGGGTKAAAGHLGAAAYCAHRLRLRSDDD